MRKILLGLLLVSFVSTSHAQTDFEPNGSFNLDIGLPNNITNYAFRELMQGLAMVTPSYQYAFNNSLAIGGGLRYGFFSINEFKNNIGLKGGLHQVGAFAKIGQEKYYGNFGLDYGLRVGYTMNFFDTNKNKEELGKALSDGCLLFEPTIGIGLRSGENSAFRLIVAYAIQPFNFRPELVGVEQFSGMGEDKTKNLTSYLTVGFGYSYYFGKK